MRASIQNVPLFKLVLLLKSLQCLQYKTIYFSDDAIYEDDTNYAHNDMNNGRNLLMDNPYQCWDLCKKTVNCVGIVWGKCDSHWVEGRFSCWLKSALVLYPETPWSVAIRYKGTTLCTFFKLIKKRSLFSLASRVIELF